MNKFKLLVATLGLVFATGVSAQTYTFNFGDKVTGTGPASSNFATLIFNNVTDKFTLTLSKDFAATFGNNAFVSAFGVDYSAQKDPGVTGIVAGGGVKAVGTSSANGPAGTDFLYTFGGGEKDRLVSAETISWYSANTFTTKVGEHHTTTTTTVAGFDITKFNGGLLHVQGITGLKSSKESEDSSSAWYSISAVSPSAVSPVPEAETSSMMLLGLGLMGFIARRRRNDQA